MGIILHLSDGILFYCRATPDVSLLLTARRNLPSLGSFQYSDQEKFFKPSYIALLIKIIFEFDRFKLLNVVKSRIHFNTGREWRLIFGGRGGGYNQMYFFGLQVDPGPINKGLTTGSLRYKISYSYGRNKHSVYVL